MMARNGTDFCGLVLDELHNARVKHSTPIHNKHEGYAVIAEELDEFWDEVRAQTAATSKSKMLKELVQTAAMCMRTAEDLGLLEK